MKTSNYLIALAALSSLTLVGCSDNDFLGDGPGGIFGGSKSNGELSFKAGGGKTTRAEITGEAAAEKLNNKFTVYGWKYVTGASDPTEGVPGFEDVFQDYVVKWQGSGSAGTTESNSSGWEYVGFMSEPTPEVSPATPYEQTIKYWDWSTKRYDFIAWSIASGNGQIKERAQVAGNTSDKTQVSSEPSLIFYAPTAKDLGGIYASDKFTSVPFEDEVGENGEDFWNDYSWADLDEGGLANIASDGHPNKEAHGGAYSQKGNNVTANQNKGIVNLMFRNLAAKARIGIYENIPGYKVSDVVFYRADASEGGSTAYKLAWTDADTDYPATQANATLFADDNIFARSGNVAVKYHDAYYHSSDDVKDNVAFADVTADNESTYFAFGELTNERGTDTPIDYTAPDGYIGTTSSTASMSIGNDEDYLYTYVFPMEENDQPLLLKVNYLLTSLDGSGEKIRVTGANAVVPAEFAKWRGNYAYTYLFKISDNTNGYTNPDASPAGLYPITFDACVVNAEEEGFQETVTTVNDRSITTYQDGQKMSENDEYEYEKDIYFTVEGSEENVLLSLEKSSNVWLYKVDAPTGTEVTEATVANYKANNIVLIDVTDLLSTSATDVPNTTGAKYPITFETGKVARFEAEPGVCYVIKSVMTNGTGTYITYKVVNVKDDDGTLPTYSYTFGETSATISNLGETAAFTIKCGDYFVTGAAGALAQNGFTVKEETDYQYTIKSNGVSADPTAGSNYDFGINGGSGITVTVTAPVWHASADATTGITTINVEQGHTIDVYLKDAAGGVVMKGFTPTVSGPDNKLKATTSDATGKITLTAAKGAYGTYTVSCNGRNLEVNVDNYTITAKYGVNVINLGDTNYDETTFVLENTNSSGSAVSLKTPTSSDASVATAGETTSGGESTITAVGVGTATISYGDAKCNVEVVNYQLVKVDDTIVLTKWNSDTGAYVGVAGASFQKETGTAGSYSYENVSMPATSTAGTYNIGSGVTGKIVFKYKNVVIASVTL